MMDWPRLTWPRKTPTEVYLRFGRWSARSYNHATGEKEAGVSVYPARLVDGVIELNWDECQPADSRALRGRCAFGVTGSFVGIGSDGEPLIRGVKALSYPIGLASIPPEVRERPRV